MQTDLLLAETATEPGSCSHSGRGRTVFLHIGMLKPDRAGCTQPSSDQPPLPLGPLTLSSLSPVPPCSAEAEIAGYGPKGSVWTCTLEEEKIKLQGPLNIQAPPPPAQPFREVVPGVGEGNSYLRACSSQLHC